MDASAPAAFRRKHRLRRNPPDHHRVERTSDQARCLTEPIGEKETSCNGDKSFLVNSVTLQIVYGGMNVPANFRARPLCASLAVFDAAVARTRHPRAKQCRQATRQ